MKRCWCRVLEVGLDMKEGLLHWKSRVCIRISCIFCMHSFTYIKTFAGQLWFQRKSRSGWETFWPILNVKETKQQNITNSWDMGRLLKAQKHQTRFCFLYSSKRMQKRQRKVDAIVMIIHSTAFLSNKTSIFFQVGVNRPPTTPILTPTPGQRWSTRTTSCWLRSTTCSSTIGATSAATTTRPTPCCQREWRPPSWSSTWSFASSAWWETSWSCMSS